MMKPKLSIYLLVIFFLLGLGCTSKQGQLKKTSVIKTTVSNQSVGKFLLDGFDEERYAGLYTYYLWSEQSLLEDQSMFNIKMLELMFNSKIMQHNSGHLYWPLKHEHPLDVDEHLKKKQWPFFIENYHQERANLILQRINWQDQAAPVLVMGFHPLGTLARHMDQEQQPIYLMNMRDLDEYKRIVVLKRLIKKILSKSINFVKKRWSKKWLVNMLKLKQDEIHLSELLQIH